MIMENTFIYQLHIDCLYVRLNIRYNQNIVFRGMLLLFIPINSIVFKNYPVHNYCLRHHRITFIHNNKKIWLIEEDKASKLRITVRNYRNIGSVSADWRDPW